MAGPYKHLVAVAAVEAVLAVVVTVEAVTISNANPTCDDSYVLYGGQANGHVSYTQQDVIDGNAGDFIRRLDPNQSKLQSSCILLLCLITMMC